jgi:hypothetical protein
LEAQISFYAEAASLSWGVCISRIGRSDIMCNEEFAMPLLLEVSDVANYA